MLFHIFLVLACLGFLIPVISIPVAIKMDCFEIFGSGFLVGSVLLLFPGMLVSCSWDQQADDLGTIVAQQEVISVYEKQRDDLNKTMASFDYPQGSLLNADSPVRSIVEQLGNVEKLLADSRAEKAKAIKSIEQRRKGPMSGVIGFVGDYK